MQREQDFNGSSSIIPNDDMAHTHIEGRPPTHPSCCAIDG